MDITTLWQPVIRLAVRQTARGLRASEREDLEQECFLALLEKQDTVLEVFGRNVKEGEKFAYTVCRNKILNILRAARHLTDCVPLNVELPPDAGSPDISGKPAGQMETAIEHYNERKSPLERTFGITEETLDKAVDRLETAEAHVIREFFFRDRTEQDIASSLGRSKWSVQQIKKRAIAHLRTLLAGEV